MKFVHLTFDTPYFRFDVYAKDRGEAIELLRKGWQTHAAQTGADLDYIDEYVDDANVLTVELGAFVRDGDVLDIDEFPAAWASLIRQKRSDIAFIHFADAYYEKSTREWVIPVEAMFDDDPDLKGWHHGNMLVDVVDGELDYSVGDWTPGMHPDCHTFKR